jgi:hypothetical protein
MKKKNFPLYKVRRLNIFFTIITSAVHKITWTVFIRLKQFSFSLSAYVSFRHFLQGEEQLVQLLSGKYNTGA